MAPASDHFGMATQKTELFSSTALVGLIRPFHEFLVYRFVGEKSSPRLTPVENSGTFSG